MEFTKIARSIEKAALKTNGFHFDNNYVSFNISHDVVYHLPHSFPSIHLTAVDLQDSPLKQEEVEIVVALGEEVAQDAGGIPTADLIGRQSKVDTLDKVPHLGHPVLVETPVTGRTSQKHAMVNLQVVVVINHQ